MYDRQSNITSLVKKESMVDNDNTILFAGVDVLLFVSLLKRMPNICNYTEDEIMALGLRLVGYDEIRQQRVARKTNITRFKRMFGSSTQVVRAVWIDLQMIKDEEYKLDVKSPEVEMKGLLLTLHFFKRYPTEIDEAGRFGWSPRSCRLKKWAFARRIQYLKRYKIRWPKEWNKDNPNYGEVPVFIVSVDGVHCEIYEPTKGSWSKNPKYYSHKFKKAGLAYEVALSVFHNRCVHINGPFPASTHDMTIFRGGLRNKIPVGSRAIVDNGYKGKDTKTSKPNPLDSKQVRRFKSRVRSRQECFNARLKNFGCLRQQFRHGEKKHKIVFEACAVICQYQLENGSPLFDS